MGKKLNINLSFRCSVIIDIDKLTEKQLKDISLQVLYINNDVNKFYKLFSSFFEEVGYDNFESCSVSATDIGDGIYLK